MPLLEPQEGCIKNKIYHKTISTKIILLIKVSMFGEIFMGGGGESSHCIRNDILNRQASILQRISNKYKVQLESDPTVGYQETTPR